MFLYLPGRQQRLVQLELKSLNRVVFVIDNEQEAYFEFTNIFLIQFTYTLEEAYIDQLSDYSGSVIEIFDSYCKSNIFFFFFFSIDVFCPVTAMNNEHAAEAQPCGTSLVNLDSSRGGVQPQQALRRSVRVAAQVSVIDTARWPIAFG